MLVKYSEQCSECVLFESQPPLTVLLDGLFRLSIDGLQEYETSTSHGLDVYLERAYLQQSLATLLQRTV